MLNLALLGSSFDPEAVYGVLCHLALVQFNAQADTILGHEDVAAVVLDGSFEDIIF
jgi:hypothetical protein